MRLAWPSLAGGLLGLFWFLQVGGGSTLNPRNVEWVLAGDWKQHWLGALFFRHEPWTFPLGTLTSLPYPVGTTIGFTDSNPILSLLLKPFAGVLPAEAQFIGLWLGFCFFMQGYMGATLARVVTRDPGHRVLTGFLFAMSPVLLERVGHDTLCAHWLVIGLLYLGLREYADRRAALRAIGLAVAAAAYAAGTHPYLAAMCWVLAHALFIRLWRGGHISLAWAGLASVFTTTAVLMVFGVIGYFSDAAMSGWGFGVFASDLLTLFNPFRFSRILPALPMQPEQSEGTGYLGLGGMIAAVIAVVVFIRARPALRKGTGAVVAAVLLLAMFAFSGRVRIGGVEILDLMWLYEPFKPLLAPFRSSGRFIWALHYFVLIFGVWGALRVFGSARQGAATALLGLLVVLQAADFRADQSWAEDKHFKRAPIEIFELAQGKYEHLVLAPMQILGVCTDRFEEDHVYRYMLLASQLGLTYNSGIFSRNNPDVIRKACNRLETTIDAGRLDPKTIYIVASEYADRMKAAGGICSRWSGQWICVSRDSNEDFRTFIETGKAVR